VSAATPIHLLPPSVADAIAAGEVVERPASVVKELCENALDAGATRVEVDVEGGGTVRIRVSDDGAGIPAGELPLAVARHATSKIDDVEDLWRIRTLGFRGEALASIAAVADLRITSRTRGHNEGATLRCRAAEVVEQGAAAGAPGTTVEVRDLFFTTPARLRFLRNPRTEASTCVRAVGDMALSHPEVGFICRVDGRVALRAPGSGALRDALRAVFGPETTAQLLDVVSTGEVAVGGAISGPYLHRAARGGMVLIVNRRRVQHRALLYAVEEAYRGRLPADRHPFGVVIVDVDPQTLDVNVHPTKREVRFRDEGRVFAAVQRCCWATLQGGTAPSAWLQWESHGGVPEATLTLHDRDADADAALAEQPVFSSHRGDVGAPTDPDAAAEPDDDSGLVALSPLRALGQARSSWLIAESPRGVVLVDPHAAHEKIIYGDLLAAWGGAGGVAGRGSAEQGAAQLLLIPAVVECDPAQITRFETHADFIARCGFTLELFGPNLLRCSAVPAAARAGDASRLVLELLDALDAGDRPASQRQHRVAALVACHSAVRLGDALDLSEQQRLLDRLVQAPGGTTCPHGRPTVLVLDDNALRRAFRRPTGRVAPVEAGAVLDPAPSTTA
jgi:DNA mismatch repair protein MutL